MALIPAKGWMLVSPTGDNDQQERADGIVVVQNASPEQKFLRGVVVRVGVGVDQDIEPGHVVHYDAYRPLQGYHLVPDAHVFAWEGDDE